MKTLYILFVTIFVTSCVSDKVTSYQKYPLEEHINIQVPRVYHVKRNKGADFYVYNIHKGEKVYLSLYLGTQPAFPSGQSTNTPAKSLVSGLPAEIITSTNSIGLLSKETNILVASQNEWFLYVTGYYYNLNVDDSREMDAVITSIQVVK